MRFVKNRYGKVLTIAVLIATLPLLAAFDSLVYFLTRPSCLNCTDLVGFLRNGSLTASLFATTLGYQLKKSN